MGIRGLWSFITNSSHFANNPKWDFWGQPVDLIAEAATANGLRLVVDCAGLMFRFNEEHPPVDWLDGGQLWLYSARVRDFFRVFLRANIHFIAVFEGAPLEDKDRRGTVSERWGTRMENIAAFMDTGDRGPFYQLRPPALLVYCFLEAVREVCREGHPGTVTFLHAGTHEADDLCAEAASLEGSFAVLAGDTDYLVNPHIKYIPLESLTINESSVTGRMYSAADTTRRFTEMFNELNSSGGADFPVAYLPDLGCLLSNDVLTKEDLESFHASQIKLLPNPDKKLIVPALAYFLASTTLPRTADGLLVLGDEFFATVYPFVTKEADRKVLTAHYLRSREMYILRGTPELAEIIAGAGPRELAITIPGNVPRPVARLLGGEAGPSLYEVAMWNKLKCHPAIEGRTSDLYGAFLPMRQAMYEIIFAVPAVPVSPRASAAAATFSAATNPNTTVVVETRRRKGECKVGTFEILVDTAAASPLYGQPAAVAAGASVETELPLHDAQARKRLYASQANDKRALFVALTGGALPARDEEAPIPVSDFMICVLRMITQLPTYLLSPEQLDVLLIMLVLNEHLPTGHALRRPHVVMEKINTRAGNPKHDGYWGREENEAAASHRKAYIWDTDAIQTMWTLAMAVWHAVLLDSVLDNAMPYRLSALFDGHMAYNISRALAKADAATLFSEAITGLGETTLSPGQFNRECMRLKAAVYAGSRWYSGFEVFPIGQPWNQLQPPYRAPGAEPVEERAVFPPLPNAAPDPGTPHAAALAKLNELVDRWFWSQENSKAQKQFRWRLLPYGSYRLGTHGPRSDMDVMCVAPMTVTHEQIFAGSLVELLQSDPAIEGTRPVPDAFVPIIKIKIMGLEVDLAFSRVPITTSLPVSQGTPHAVSPDAQLEAIYAELLDPRLLNRIAADPKSVASCRGPREAVVLTQLVPDFAVFRAVLRAVKDWQAVRYIGSHASCFLGGFSWALMVAKVCRLLPRASPPVVLAAFFRLYANWPYPEPILLIPLEDIPTSNADAGLKAWSKKDAKYHKMPVLSVVHPPENTARNVTESTLRTLTREFRAAATTVAKMEAGLVTDWSWLTVPAPTSVFLTIYGTYLQLELVALKEADLAAWIGWVTSRTPALVEMLEKLGFHVHPCSKLFRARESTDATCSLLVGLARSPAANPTAKPPSQELLTAEVANFCAQVDRWPLREEGMVVAFSTHRAGKLPPIFTAR